MGFYYTIPEFQLFIPSEINQTYRLKEREREKKKREREREREKKRENKVMNITFHLKISPGQGMKLFFFLSFTYLISKIIFLIFIHIFGLTYEVS